ncbi:MAG: hypothetical protein MZV65_31420 [Chromatiales bacterium]|nr:hypothetical protein [Chromatiales bacterium]
MARICLHRRRGHARPGYRLAGAEVRVPAPAEAAAALRAGACADGAAGAAVGRAGRARRRRDELAAPRWPRERRWCWSCPTCTAAHAPPDLARDVRSRWGSSA